MNPVCFPRPSLSSFRTVVRGGSAAAVVASLLLVPRAAQADDEGPLRVPPAGPVTFDLRPVGIEAQKTNSGVDLTVAGLQAGVGTHLSPDWYVGAAGDVGLVMNLGQGEMAPMYRLGGEAKYTFGQSTAQLSTNGDDGPWTPVPFLHSVGVRAGAQTLDTGNRYTPFAEIEYGGDAQVNNSFQFGIGVAAGLTQDPSGSGVDPYGSMTFRLGFDV
jgi:hypothetical protein